MVYLQAILGDSEACFEARKRRYAIAIFGPFLARFLPEKLCEENFFDKTASKSDHKTHPEIVRKPGHLYLSIRLRFARLIIL